MNILLTVVANTVIVAFEQLLNTSEVGNLAPMAAVMLPEALAYAAKPQHLSGQRVARF